MMKKSTPSAQKRRAELKKASCKTPPVEFLSLLPPGVDLCALLGVNRVTLARWLSGQSRIPFAAAQLLRLLSGELPRHFGPWQGWRLDPLADEITPPGWGQGIRREDVIGVWRWRQDAFRAQGLDIENARLKNELDFFRRESKEKAPLAFAAALVEVLEEL